MKFLPRILPGEPGRVLLLSFLLCINALVLESTEVVATSGFVSNVGVPQILAVWTTVMLIAMLASSGYVLVVDRVNRAGLGIGLFLIFSLIYTGFYLMFIVGAPDFLTYGLLAVITEQQWTLLPLLIWALANDTFTVSEAKRLFPLLSAMAFLGGVVGNALAAAIGQTLGSESYRLLLINAVLVLFGAGALLFSRSRLTTPPQHVSTHLPLHVVIREGIEFVRDVPAYRFLSIAMILMGLCLNTIEFQFLYDVATHYTDPGRLQTFYAIYKIASVPVLLLLQAWGAAWLLNHIGFKHIFALLPGGTFLALLLTMIWINPIGIFTGAIVGSYVVRQMLAGIDQPARRAFQGLVPDQRRGRVSALMEGFLYPLGSVLSCAFIGSVLFGVSQGWLAPATGRLVYIGGALVCAAAALVAIQRFHTSYDKSMLSWRLKRRQHGRSILDQLEF